VRHIIKNMKIEIKLAIGNPEVGISDYSCCCTVGHSKDILPSSKQLRVTDHAAVADIGYIELFDKLNRNNTNYTRGYDYPVV
jgi:hypothetical protein